jgi:hypothetical protein
MDQEKALLSPQTEEISTLDLGGRTFEDRQSAAAFSTLMGRAGLKEKVLQYELASPPSQQERHPLGLRDRTRPDIRTIPGGVASKFRIRPAENS